ncbi:MAG: SDR family oxidoreductase [Planctomycetia bacterium]|nr:SDR family oxidoreductase [Planctomycetia bacterium]
MSSQTMNPLFSLAGRSALVTGGSKGLGKAMARVFAEAGADVAICSRHENELAAAIKEITAGTKVRGATFVGDLSKRSEAKRLADAVVAKLGKVDILVNNAGSNVPQALDQITDEAWDKIVELNLSSCMAMSRALVGGMKQRKWGRIIHISSIMALGSKERRHSYSATKAALIGMARAMAIELGPFNITVNCIAPGPFLTDLPGKLLSDEEKRVFAQRTALGRWGDPHELAGPALLLASDAGSYITGATLVVDGGTVCKTF